jgi:hypothetical protein
MSGIVFTQTDPFFSIQTRIVSTSEWPVGLPILYRKARNLNAFFLVDQKRVEAALDEAGASSLQPTCEWIGNALIALACFEYVDTTIGPYNEIVLAAAVVRTSLDVDRLAGGDINFVIGVPMPCARRHRSERKRAASRRSVTLASSAIGFLLKQVMMGRWRPEVPRWMLTNAGAAGTGGAHHD